MRARLGVPCRSACPRADRWTPRTASNRGCDGFDALASVESRRRRAL